MIRPGNSRRENTCDHSNGRGTSPSRIAGVIEQRYACEITALEPEDYNREWEKVRNVNLVIESGPDDARYCPN